MAGTLLVCCAAHAADTDCWEKFKAGFLKPDGRIVDIYQKNMSHSEGQAYGMLLAVSHGDREAFEKIWAWTKANLQTRPDDSLASWAFGESLDGTWKVLDRNNATDGDLVMAWALELAYERWNLPGAREASRRLAVDIERLLLLDRDGRHVLMPGADGFFKDGTAIFNPSYFCFPAFEALARSGDRTVWDRLQTDSLTLIELSRTGPLSLPPDWAALKNGKTIPWPDRPPLFSYDAIRIPLYLALDGRQEPLEMFRPLIDKASSAEGLSARIALESGEPPQGQDEPAPAGYYAVLALAADALKLPEQSNALWLLATNKLIEEPQAYYSNVLYCLAVSLEKPK